MISSFLLQSLSLSLLLIAIASFVALRVSRSQRRSESEIHSLPPYARLCCQQQTATLNARSKAATGREEQRQRIRESGERVPMLLMPFNPFPSSSLACEVLQSFREIDWLTEGDSERKRLLNAIRKEAES